MIIRACVALGSLVPAGSSAGLTGPSAQICVLFNLAWAALTLGAFLADLPRSRHGYLILLSIDLVVAIDLMLLQLPVLALPLLLAGGIAWRSAGGKGPISPTLPGYLGVWAVAWGIEPDLASAWLKVHPTHADLFRLLPPLGVLAWLIATENKRRDKFRQLGSEDTIDPVGAAKQAFTYDFSKWTEAVVNLCGGDARSDCAIGLLSRSGTLQMFGTIADNVDRAGVMQLCRSAQEWLPEKLSVIHDRAGVVAPERSIEVRNVANYLRLKRRLLVARHLTLGTHRGLAVLALDFPADAILKGELETIDAALDQMLERVATTIEMRRAFLAEARDVARRDLHDGVLQSLAAIRMRLLTILNESGLEESAAGSEIRTTADIISLEQARLRDLLENDGEYSHTLNLVASLRLAAKALSLQWEVQIDLVTDEVAIPMHAEAVNNIEHLFREVVANAMRHSKTKHISCALAIRDSDLVISLIDSSADGQKENEPPKGNPLDSQSLIRRLTLVNGRAYSDGLSGGRLLAIAIPLVYEEDD
jgi:signal transduction histidine kinase